MKQYAFEFKMVPHFSRDDFVVAEANKEAFAWATSWPSAKQDALIQPAVYLYGPEGSGKTHLCHIWTQQHQAVFLTRAMLASPIELMQLVKTYETFVLENIEAMLADQAALFHLYNMIKEHQKSLLITSTVAPMELALTLPDLRSRLATIPAIEIKAPDEALLAAVLHKQFFDRQLRVSHGAIFYLLSRIDRSFTEVHKVVAIIDRYALERKRNITIPLLRSVLKELRENPFLVNDNTTS